MNEAPALLGGTPIFPDGPPSWPQPDPAVAAALDQAMASGQWGRYDGESTAAFESELADFHKTAFAGTCASGTLAVELALRAAGVGPGDEVILAAYDYEPSFVCVHAIGALPVLVDVAPHHWNLEPANVEAAISPRTKAILVSHLHGGIVPMAGLIDLARGRGLVVVEDAAQATGAIHQGRRAGTWGDIGVLSFGGSKLMTAGRGGALLTSHAQTHQKLRLLLRRGIQQWAPLSELQATVLRPQLASLDAANLARFEAVRLIHQEIRDIPGVRLFSTDPTDRPSYYKVGLQFDSAQFGLSRERLVEAVKAEGVALEVGFRALHLGRAPQRFRITTRPIESERAHQGCLLLHHPVLLSRPVDVARALRKVYLNADRLRALGPLASP